MNEQTNKGWYILIIVIVVAAILLFAFRASIWPPTSTNGEYASSTTSTNGQTNSTSAKYSSGSKGSVSPVTDSTISDNSALVSLINSALIRVPNTGVDVALTQGSATYSEASIHGRVTAGPIIGKVKTNDGYDVFTDMTVDKGGVSIFHYVALFHAYGQQIKYTSAAVVADRVSVLNVMASADPALKINSPQGYFDSVGGYILTVNYLDRKNGEPMTATPSVARTLSLHVRSHVVSR